MKTKFEVGDVCKVVANKAAHKLKIGTIVKLTTIVRDDPDDYIAGAPLNNTGITWAFYPSDLIKITPRHLIITKITRTRAGKKYFTWQFKKGNKVSNHQYNTKPSRDKQLNKFIEDIKSGNYEIK